MRFKRLPKVGSRRGNWVLKSRRRNADGTFTDKWVYDPVATIQGYPTDTLYCTSEAAGYGDSTNGYIWKKKTTVVGSENSDTSIKTGNAAAGTYFGFYCGCTDKAVTGLPASFDNGRGWRIETAKAYPSVGVIDVYVRVLNRAAYAHAGKVCVRLFKGTNPDGTGLTALTGWVESPNTITFSATAGEAKTDRFSVTFDPPISIAANEYIYVQFAWKVTTAATNANAGVKLAVNTTTPTAILIPSTINKAYTYAVSNATSPITNAGVATTEFTATDYTNVSSDNAVYVATSASVSVSGRYANVAHRFTFDLSAYPGIVQIVYRWDGYASETLGKIQHKETTGWITDFTSTPTSDGAGFEATKTLTNISDIVINGIFEFGLYISMGYPGEAYIITIYSDYVEIEVTYGIVKFVETVYVSSIPKRSAKYKRKRVGDLSVITDFFSYVYTPVVKVFKQYFVENLSILSAYIRTARSYSRAKVAQVPVSTYYVRKTAYSRRIVDIAYISGIFKRLVNYKRRIVNTAYVSDVFRRKLSFQRFHVENLSVTRDLFKRRVGYIRRFIQTAWISDIFKRAVRYFRAWKENIPTSDIFKRRIAYTRRMIARIPLSAFFRAVRSYRRLLPQTVAVRDLFKRAATYRRRIVANLSALKAILRRSVSYTRRIVNLVFISTILRKIIGFPRRFVEDLSALRALFKRKVSYFRRLVNFTFITDVFRHVYTPIVRFFRYALVENLSVLSDIFKRQVSYARRILNLAYISEVFRKFASFPRRFVEDLSALAAAFKRRVSYLRKIVNLTFITDIFSYVYTPIVKFYKRYFVENLSVLSAVLKRRAQYTRRAVNFTFISEVFRKSAGFPRKFVEDLSVITAKIIIPLELKLKALKAKAEEIERKLEEAIKKLLGAVFKL